MARNQTISGTSSTELLRGDSGNDFIYGNGGNDTLIGGEGNDLLAGGGGNDSLSGGDGNDAVYGNGGNDTFDGGDGNDGLYGGSGNDVFKASTGNDAIYGNGGFDTYDATALAMGIRVDLGLNATWGPGNQAVYGVEQVLGSSFADTLAGGSGDEVMSGNAGNDELSGGGGNDTLVTGAGNDTLLGGSGNDTVIFDGATADGRHVLDGGSGSDMLELRLTGAQFTTAFQAEFQAYEAFIASPGNVGAPFTFESLGQLQAQNFSTVTLTVDGAPPPANAAPVIDVTATTESTTVVHGQSVAGTIAAVDPDGDPLTYGLSSAPGHGDVSVGADGRFNYTAGQHMGHDSFTVFADDGLGGRVEHTVDVGVWGELDTSAAPARVVVSLANDTVNGNAVADGEWAIDVRGSGFGDIIHGDAGANVLRGGAGNDQLNGQAGEDVLHGGEGNDGIWGGGGHDRLLGDSGNDVVIGDGGHDVLVGGRGNDIMYGGQFNGAGLDFNDTFGWSREDVVNEAGGSAGFDRVKDFSPGDRLDFSGIFADAGPVAASDVLRVTDTEAGLVVAADVGGGTFVDVVVLEGLHDLALDDLVGSSAIIV